MATSLRVSAPSRFLRLRVMSPLGLYPDCSIAVGRNRLLVRDDVIVSLVVALPPETHGLGLEHWSDLEFLALEEVRFLASIALAMRPDHGMVYAYPLPFHLDLARLEEDEGCVVEQAVRHMRAKASDFAARGAVLPPMGGGPPYARHERPLDEILLSSLIQRGSLQDHLLMRGLAALLKADMLWQRREFGEAATMMLFVAMEASFQMVLRTLRASGVSNPSADDAGAFLDQVFNPGISTGPYLAEHYEHRIRSLHPSSRFGVFAFPPLESDDFYQLRITLVSLYVFLIADHVWSDLWHG
ncbi:hypothetical protein [Rhodospirillaceae bacterium SYSU D60014]|uniref:hypothetical protein n=1 Tax=Virgifigura deserti TaxID=2268457 RepID=UPI000E666104